MHSRRSYGHWRLLFAEPRSGAENMARDTALLARAARTGETVFSVYSWEQPTLSFGRNQTAVGCYDVQKIRGAGLEIVRRPTGGRAILHDREVTYSVTAPLEGAPPLREAYTRINGILLDGLARLGVSAEVARAGACAPAPTNRPCFETPTEGEVIARGRKLVGSAQWRDEEGLLQHGSILVDDDQSALSSLASSALLNSEVIPAPATLTNLMGSAPATAAVAAAMFEAVRSLEDSEAEELNEAEIRSEALALLPKYLDEDWTWRR
jgi:lipoyl(octanoyl) transferase